MNIFRGLIMKLYLWDKAATEFYKKVAASAKTPVVRSVNTINP